MLLTRSLRQSILRILFSIPNRCWFWWTLFITDLSLTNIFIPLLKSFLIKELISLWLGYILVLLASAQFIVIMFWTSKVVTRIELYGHWRGREVAEKLKRETAVHQELNRLREAMIFGEIEGDAYWSVIQQLESAEDSNYI